MIFLTIPDASNTPVKPIRRIHLRQAAQLGSAAAFARRDSLRYTPDVPELLTEIQTPCHQLAVIEEQAVVYSAAVIAGLYRRESFAAMALAAVDAMVTDGPQTIDEDDPRLVPARQRLRDPLQGLLVWVSKTGRL
jgi:hypothetical protein